MKNIFTALILCLFCAIGVKAQAPEPDNTYYVDMVTRNDVKYYFTWYETGGYYWAYIPQLDGDFVIRKGDGKGDANNFGCAANQSGGVAIGSEKQLANPGTNFSMEGGKIIYGAVVEFYPDKMTMIIRQGSYTKPEVKSITATINDSYATGPQSGMLMFTIGTKLIENPQTKGIVVTISYNDADGKAVTQSQTLENTLNGTFALTDLAPNATTSIKLTATLTDDGKTYTADATTSIATNDMPILIGTIAGHVWDPSYGINGTPLPTSDLSMYNIVGVGPIYFYMVNLTNSSNNGPGEFSFVTKLGTSSTDWVTVEANPRYVPANNANRVSCESEVWYPYERFASGSHSGAWQIADFTPNTYCVFFDFGTKKVMVMKSSLTGVEQMDVRPAEDMNQSVAVYDLQGRCLKQNVERGEATQGLDRGIYIVGGMKVLVR